MKFSLLATGVLVVLATALLTLEARGQMYTCEADTEHALHARDYIISLVAATTDQEDVETRLMYQLPLAKASSVSIETRRQTCESAGRAFHRHLYADQPEVPRSLVVTKVGTARYVVFDENERAGEFSITIVFDAKWTALAVIAS